MTPLHGFRIEVSKCLIGSKKAIRQGDTIFVSPAMRSLMDGASHEELERLLANIPLLMLPVFNFSMPLVSFEAPGDGEPKGDA